MLIALGMAMLGGTGLLWAAVSAMSVQGERGGT